MGILLVLVAGLGLLGIFFFQPRPILDWIAARNPEVLYYVHTNEQVAALTIDDGPHPRLTPEILDVLEENDVRATFFLIGERIKGNMGILDRMRDEGHELANHMWTDRPSLSLSADEFERQLLKVDRLIFPVQPKKKWFRPGSGWFSKRMLLQLDRNGYRCALGSVYPHDTKLRNVSLISRFVLGRIHPGAVILLHDGGLDRRRTVDVLRRVLPELKAKGYRFVTLTELAEYETNRASSGIDTAASRSPGHH